MLKLYLDTCSLQRPLDSKTQMLVILESEAILNILICARWVPLL